jgi:protein-ribulosamine 3-kinase
MCVDRPEDRTPHLPKVRPGPIQWLTDRLRTSIEETVSDYIGREWSISDQADYSEFAYHLCAVVSDPSFSIFFKFSTSIDAEQQFNVEIANLRYLSDMTGVLVPRVVGVSGIDGGWLLIMEALDAVTRGPDQWGQIGKTLARIHRVKGESFGFERKGYWGPIHQDNTPSSNWVTFFGERRLLPLFELALRSGRLPAAVATRIEHLVGRLPELCGPEVTPVLLHGDSQQNNFVSTAGGTFVIDPAIYYGHPEMDLALIDSFQPVPSAVFDAYAEEIWVDKGFRERRHLWRLPLYLAAVALEGAMHLEKLTDAVDSLT